MTTETPRIQNRTSLQRCSGGKRMTLPLSGRRFLRGVFAALGAFAVTGVMVPEAKTASATNTNSGTSLSLNWTNTGIWTNTAGVYPGSTDLSLTNFDTAGFQNLTNSTITLSTNLNIQSISFLATATGGNAISGSGTLFLTKGGTIRNFSTTANVTNTINNSIAFVGGEGTYTFDSANNNNSNALAINGAITSSNAGTTTMVVGGQGSNLKIVFGGNIVDSASNKINLIAGGGGNSPSTSTGTNSGASGLYFTGNNNFNSLLVGSTFSASVYAIFTGSNTVRNEINVNAGRTLNASSLVISGANGYLSNSANNINVGLLGMLVYDNGATSVTNRFGSSTVTLNGGRLIVTSTNTNAVSSAFIRQINLGSNVNSYLTNNAVATNAGTTNTLTIGGIGQGSLATLQATLIGSTNTGGRVIITNGPTLVGGILPWAIDTVSGSFLSYTNSGGTNLLGGFGSINGTYTNNFSVATANTDNVTVSGTPTLASNTTINSIRFSSNGAVTLNLGANTLTLASGGFLFGTNQALSITNGSLTVGSGTNVLYLWDNGTTAVKSVGATITDNGSAVNVIKAGPGTTFFSGTNSYSGQTLIQSGTLVVTNNGNLGASTTTVIYGAGLTIASTNSVLSTNSITVLGTLTIAGTTLNTLTGLTIAKDTNSISGQAAGSTNFSGSATVVSAGTYSGTNAIITNGVGGSLLVFSTNADLLSYTKSAGSFITLAQTNPGVSVTIQNWNLASAASNSLTILSGGNWAYANGGGNTGSDYGTNIITNNAAMTVYAATLHAAWNIGQGSLILSQNVTQSGGNLTTNGQALRISIGSNGAMIASNGITLGGGYNTAGNQAGATNSITVDGGVLRSGGGLVIGNAYGTTTAMTNATALLAINGGSVSATGLTIGSTQTANGTNNTFKASLTGGNLFISGTLTSGSGTVTANSNSFVWTGGTLSAGTIVATNTAGQAGWVASETGSSISNNTLYNTNAGTLLVGNTTNEFAGRTVITGNYQQSGSSTASFNIYGTTQASSWAGATNQYSFLSVSGNGTISGGKITLNMGSYVPASGNTFNILTTAANGLKVTAGLSTLLTGSNVFTTIGGSNVAFASDGLTFLRLSTNATTLTATGAFNQWSTSGGNFSSGASWSGGVVPNSARLAGYFGTAVNGGNASVDTNATVGALSFSNATAGYNLTAGGGTLTIDGTSMGTNGMIRNIAGSHTITAPVRMATTLEVTNSGSTTMTLAGALSGAGGLQVDANGAVVLGGVNSYSGANTVNTGGLLIVTNAGTLSSGALVINGGLVLGNTVNSAPGLLSGSGSVTQTGTGTLTLASGNNTFSGTNALQAGGLVVGGSSTLTSSTINQSGGSLSVSGRVGQVNVSGGTASIAGTAGNIGLTGGTAAITGTVGNVNAGGGTLTGVAASMGSLTVSGGATVAPGGAGASSAVNLTVSSLVLNGGIFSLNVFGAGQIDTISATDNISFGSSPVTLAILTNGFSGGWDQTQSTNFTIFSGANATAGTFSSNNFSFTGSSPTIGKWSVDTNATSLLLVYTVSSTTITVSSLTGTLNESDDTTQTTPFAGDATMLKVGAGEYALNLSNSYSGATYIAAGTLTAATDGALGTTATIYLGSLTNNAASGSNAVFQVSAPGQTISPSVTVAEGAAQYAVQNSSGGTVVLSGGLSLGTNTTLANTAGGNLLVNSAVLGVGSLNVSPGSGTVTLAAANTYSGGTTLNGGVLAVSNSTALGTGTLTVSTNATIQSLANANLANSVNIAAGGNTLTLDAAGRSVTNSGNISGTGASLVASATGGGTLTLSGSNSYTGASRVNSGTLALGSANALPTSTDVTVTATGVLDMRGFNESVATLSDGGVGTGILTNSTGSSTLTLGGDGNSSFSGAIGGFLGLTKLGLGTLTLGGANSYTGATVINGGSFVLNGSLSNSGVSVASGAGFTQNSFGVLAGSGGLTNAGTAVLNGSNSYTGATLVSGGSLTLNGSLSNNGLTVASGAGFTQGSSSVLAGSGGLTNAGTAVLNGSNSYTGATLVSGGSLTLNGSLSNNGLTVASGAGFTQGSSSVLAGSGGLTNAGTAVLNGSNNYTGATLVSGGSLTLNGSLNGTSITVTNATFTQGSTGVIGGTNPNTPSGGSLTFNSGSTGILGGTNNLAFGSLITVNSNASVSFTSSAALNAVNTNGGASQRTQVLAVNGGTAYFTNNGVTNVITAAGSLNNGFVIISGVGNGATNLVISNGATLQQFAINNGGTSFLLQSNALMQIGNGGTYLGGITNNTFWVSSGTLQIASGGFFSSIGNFNGSSATGAGNSYVTNAGTFSNGGGFYMNGPTNQLDNTGSFTVATGGGFRMQSGVSTANFLAGSTSSINGIYLGVNSGTNLLTVYGGATLTTPSTVSLGYSGGQSNTVVINTGGVWNATGIVIGQSGAIVQNNLVSNNGTITAGGLSFNTQSGGGNVSRAIQSAGTWTVTSVQIGGGNGGQTNSYALLNVTGGVFSNSGTMTFQGNPNGNGTNVNNNNVFQVDGGTAYAGTGITLGNTNSLTGSNAVNLNGGTLVLNGTLSATTGTQQTNSFNWNGGALSIATVTANSAAWNGPGSISNNTLYNTAGIMAPGVIGVAGRTVVTGNYWQGSNASLAVDLNGTNAATAFQNFPGSFYDTVTVSGTATLGGDLLLSIGNGFAPASTNSFSVLTSTNSVGGMFSGAHTALVNGITRVVATDGLSVFTATNTGKALVLTNYLVNQYAGGVWGSGGNAAWTGMDPNSGAYTAYFGTNVTNSSVVMDQGRTVSGLIFSNSASTGLTASGGAVLTLTNNSGVTTNASLTVSAGGLTIDAPIQLRSSLVIADTVGTDVKIYGNITEGVAGSGVTLASNNTGFVTLYGTNSYTGTTVVNGGYLILSGTNALSPSSLNSSKLRVGTGATLIFGVGGPNAYSSAQISSALVSGAFQAGSGIGYDATGTNFSLASLGSVSSLYLAGSGTVTVDQDVSNLSNGITLIGGALAVAPSVTTSNALGGAGVSITLNSTNASKLDLGGTLQTVGNIINTSSFGGVMTLTNGVLTIAPGNSGNIATFAGLQVASNASIVSEGIVALTTVGTDATASSNGVSILAGSNNVANFFLQGGSLALENNLALNGSTLTITAPVSLSSSAGFTNAGGTTVDFSGSSSMTIAGNLDFGSANVNAGTTTLNVASNGALTFTNGINGGALTKTGAGTLILGGNNTSSSTTLNGGTILSLGANSLGANLTLASGLLDLGGFTNTFSTVAFNGNGYTVTNGSFAVTSGYTASNASVTLSLAGDGATFTAGGGTVSLLGTNTYTGATTVTNGTLYSTFNAGTTYTVTNPGSRFVVGAAIDPGWTPSAVSSIAMDSNTILAIDATGTNFQMTSSLTNGANATLGTYGSGTVTLADLATNFSAISSIALSSGTIDLGGVNATNQMVLTNVTVSGGTIRNGTLSTTNLTIVSNTVASINANLAGTSGLALASNQVISLGGSNSYSGTTTVTNATLNFASSGALSSVSNSLLTVNNGGQVNFTNAGSSNQTLANTAASQWTINSGGQVTISNNNSVTLGAGGVNPNNNVVSVNGGLLTIGGSGSLSISPGQGGRIGIANGGTVAVLSGGYLAPGNFGQAWGTGGGTNTMTNAFGGVISMAGAYVGNGGTNLNQFLNSGLVSNSSTLSIGQTATTTATNLVRNFGSGTITGGGTIVVGANNAALNAFVNEGTVSQGSFNIGNSATSSRNVMSNTGTMTLTASSSVGTAGINNILFNAGSLTINNAFFVGSTGAAGLNEATNSGAGTITANSLAVGNGTAASANNRLINDGTLRLAGNATIGAGGSNNLLVNTGTLTNSSAIIVGNGATGINTVSNTGTMTVSQIQLGGTGTTAGATNTLISSGTLIITGSGGTSYNIGNSVNATGVNELRLTGGIMSNSTASTAPWINIGNAAAASGTNIFSLSGGAQYIGYGTTNVAQWRNIFLGNAGSQYNLLTNNGGSISNIGQIIVGAGSSNNANTAYLGNGTITALQNSSAGVYVGGNATNQVSQGSTNTFTLASGGVLTQNNSSIGAFSVSNNNTFDIQGGQATVGNFTFGAATANYTNGATILTAAGNTNTLNLGGGTLTANQFLAGASSLAAGDSNRLMFNGGTLQAGASSQTNFLASNIATVTIGAGGGTIDSATRNITVGASMSGAGALTKAGAGTLTLSGSNSYTGGTTINGGTLLLTSTNAAGSGGVSLSGGSTFGFSNAAASMLTNDITVASGATGIIRSYGANTLTLSGTLTKQGSILQFLGGSYNVTGRITGTSGSFNSDLVLTNGASVTLSRSADYYGPTYVAAGSTLTAGVGNALPGATVLYLGASGETSTTTNSYNLNGYSQTLGGLNDSGGGVNRIFNNGGASLLTLAGNSTFGGSINGNLGLTVTGGTVNLTGINDYIGTTTITGNGTKLNLGTTGSLNHTSNVIVSAGSTFLLGASSKVNASAGLRLDGGTISMGGNGSTRAGYQAFGTLTLTGNSVIDFADLAGNSALSFNSITMNGNSLSIYNWSGTSIWGNASPTQPGTITQLLSNTGLSQSDLNNISFFSGSGTGFLGNGFWNGGEIVPVPEPGVVIAAVMLLGWLIAANRGTLFGLIRRRR